MEIIFENSSYTSSKDGLIVCDNSTSKILFKVLDGANIHIIDNFKATLKVHPYNNTNPILYAISKYTQISKFGVVLYREISTPAQVKHFNQALKCVLSFKSSYDINYFSYI